MTVKIETCEDYARLARCMVGFTYAARFQNKLFGASPITLKNVRKNGENLEFSSSWEFIEENYLPGRLGMTPEDGEEIYRHISNCNSNECQDAKRKSDLLGRFFKELDKQGGGCLGGLLIASTVHGKIMPLIIERENGWGKTIDLLIPVFELYTDHRGDFVWPGEGRIRFEGYSHTSFNGSNGIQFTNPQRGKEEKTIKVPYDLVRKLRYQGCSFEEGRDIWRNSEVYHVHLSHPNEEKYNRSDQIALELREDKDEKDIKEMSRKIIEAEIGLKKVE